MDASQSAYLFHAQGDSESSQHLIVHDVCLKTEVCGVEQVPVDV